MVVWININVACPSWPFWEINLWTPNKCDKGWSRPGILGMMVLLSHNEVRKKKVLSKHFSWKNHSGRVVWKRFIMMWSHCKTDMNSLLLSEAAKPFYFPTDALKGAVRRWPAWAIIPYRGISPLQVWGPSLLYWTENGCRNPCDPQMLSSLCLLTGRIWIVVEGVCLDLVDDCHPQPGPPDSASAASPQWTICQ